MALTLQIGDVDLKIPAQPLTQEGFMGFGDVVSNPRPGLHPHTAASQQHHALLPNASSANQGTAIQYRNVSRIRNLYPQAPSGKRGEPRMSMFVCAARQLRPSYDGTPEFTVRYLERHPFTTQTFSPLRSTASSYLVIVAPSLPPGRGGGLRGNDDELPAPTEGQDLPGRGLPNLQGLRAFVATADQAVTYGAGTWHAPMVALGEPGTALDFVVFQYGNGREVEDCQLVELESPGEREPRVTVSIPRRYRSLSKL